VARTLFVVVVVFVLCRVPFTALIIMRSELRQGTQTKNQVSLMPFLPFSFTRYSFNNFEELRADVTSRMPAIIRSGIFCLSIYELYQ